MNRRKLAAGVVIASLVVALLASFIASDRPLVLRYDGTTYWLPNLIDYDALRGLRGDRLRRRMTRDDWAVWAPIRYSPTGVRTDGELRPLQAPSSKHWLGTDDRGRDVLARLIHGTRATAVMALGAAALALLVGVILALLAAWFRRVDPLVIVSCDSAAAMPAIVVVVAAQGLIGSASLLAAIVLIAIPRAADTARIARAGLRTALHAPFCDAARAAGASPLRVLLRHALPNTASQLAVATALTAATAVLAEAALSFIGFGTPPPAASWGELLKQASQNQLRWWLAIPAGLAIATLTACLNALAQPQRGRT